MSENLAQKNFFWEEKIDLDCVQIIKSPFD